MIVLITAIISPFLSIKSVRKTRTLQTVEKPIKAFLWERKVPPKGGG